MWPIARRRISPNVFARFLLKESLNDPDIIPRTKAWTIKTSFLVWSFTANAPNRLSKSFKGSPWCYFTPKRSKGTEGGARLTMNCSLNNEENWSNEVMWPSGRPINQSSVLRTYPWTTCIAWRPFLLKSSSEYGKLWDWPPGLRYL